ncbi:hypothetical protein NQ318_016183 [Aromia moschata]|uniref:Uncharacterized protein n=1 Tax=Aromia moschata TaxID=1265417 RepID=A0AAV8YGB7_9CUCU|nr:hypothetical protein NQ318_016183 [Aromia moschata]
MFVRIKYVVWPSQYNTSWLRFILDFVETGDAGHGRIHVARSVLAKGAWTKGGFTQLYILIFREFTYTYPFRHVIRSPYNVRD